MSLARLRVDRVRAAWRRPAPLLAPLALMVALAGHPGLALAQAPERVVGEDGQVRYLTPLTPHVHAGWTLGLELGVGDATAFGGGQTYSLSSLAGGDSGPKLSMLFHLGHGVTDAVRLGLVLGATVANGKDSGLAGQASIGRVDLEASWLPSGDGLFLRGAAGYAWLSVTGDSGIQGRDLSAGGLDLSAGVGWFAAPWRAAYPGSSSHLMVALDLGWQYYFDNAATGGQIKASLTWSLRAGFHSW